MNLKFLAALLFGAMSAGLPLSALAQAGFVRIESVSRAGEEIHIESGPPTSSATRPGWQSADWSLEPAGPGQVRIKNRWKGTYLHVETGTLSAGPIQPGWLSAIWVTESVSEGVWRFRNAWKGTYLNVERGVLEASAARAGALSAQWRIKGPMPNLAAASPPPPAPAPPPAPPVVAAAAPAPAAAAAPPATACAVSGTPARQVVAQYVATSGQSVPADAAKALAAAVSVMQGHYLSLLGRTFAIRTSSPALTLNSTLTGAEQTDWLRNYQSLESDCRNGLVSDQNMVVSASSATTGPGGGSWGVTKMTDVFWNELYKTYMLEPQKIATVLHGWSHEFGHAFGLGHTYDMPRACWSTINSALTGNDRPSLVMNKTSDRDSVFKYPFTADEKTALLDPASSQAQTCLPLASSMSATASRNRAHASVYLNSTRLDRLDLRSGALQFLWMADSNGLGRSLRVVGQSWVEADAAGKDLHSFLPQPSPGGELLLMDPSRLIRLKVDLASWKVYFSQGNNSTNFAPLYDIQFVK